MSRKPPYDSGGHSDKHYIERQPRHQSYAQSSTSRGYHLNEYPYQGYADANDDYIARYEDLPYRQPQEAPKNMVKSSKQRQTENAYLLPNEPWSASNSGATSYRPSNFTPGPHSPPLSVDALSYDSSYSPSYNAKPLPETSNHMLQGSPYDDGSFSSGTEVFSPGSHPNCIKDLVRLSNPIKICRLQSFDELFSMADKSIAHNYRHQVRRQYLAVSWSSQASRGL